MSNDPNVPKSSDKENLLARLDVLSHAETNKLDFLDAFKQYFSQSFNNYSAKDRSAKVLLEDVRNRNDIFYHWSRIAEILYSEIDVRTTIVVRESKGTLEIGVDEQRVLNVVNRIYAVPPDHLTDRKTSLYRPEIGTPMFNVFFGAFLSALNLTFHKIVNEAGYSPSELFRIIDEETLRAPFFREVRGKLSYVQADVRGDELVERKKLVEERCAELEKFAIQRANEQPDLNLATKRYSDALKRLDESGGALRLFFAGFEIESLVRIKRSAPPDAERNRPLDADLLFVIRSLMIVHAALISVFKDVEELAHELDRYNEQLATIETLGDRIFDPVLDELAKGRGVFDDGTIELTAAVRRLDEQEQKFGLVPTRQSVGAKHGWVRAALGAIGRVAL